MPEVGDTINLDDVSGKHAASHGGPLQILGRANSFNVRKVLWVCDEIGIRSCAKISVVGSGRPTRRNS